MPKLIDLAEKVVYGGVWEHPGLSKRDRSLITVATLVALGREKQLVYLAFHAGWPAAMTAAVVAKDVFAQR